MIAVDSGGKYETWREVARTLLERGVPPDEVIWEPEPGLFGAVGSAVPSTMVGAVKVPAAFVGLARSVSCHKDPSRWALLYRILWRIVRGGERHLLEIASDGDVSRARDFEKAVGREIHKMHAFVRFQLMGEDEESGRERYAAWFEPDHWIVEAAAPFFRKRFANMDWSIFTPKGCAHWVGGKLSYSPGLPANPIENPDELERTWKTYYRSIFNPARLKVKAMKAEMPVRYWKNLPEAGLIRELIDASRPRVDRMLAEEPRPLKSISGNRYLEHLRALSGGSSDEGPAAADLPIGELAKVAAGCRNCPLWERSTQVVFGEGPEDARIMIVGEQPGDREDVSGRVFVGPAGKVLDLAFAQAGIERSEVYLTNAVKHFKWTPRGKDRLHQKPDAGEIEACRPWILHELERVTPEVLILLGATAARSLLGGVQGVKSHRGVLQADHLAPRVILTVHPSYLLRFQGGEAEREEEFRRFVADLRLAVG
jgi:uracil-DNA glycosylase